MPLWAERMLAKRARKLGLKGKRRAAYIYGTLYKHFGWRPKRRK